MVGRAFEGHSRGAFGQKKGHSRSKMGIRGIRWPFWMSKSTPKGAFKRGNLMLLKLKRAPHTFAMIFGGVVKGAALQSILEF